MADQFIVGTEGAGIGGRSPLFGDGVPVMEAPIAIPYAALKDALDLAKAAATGTFDTAKVRLFKSDFVPNVDTVLADLTAIEADFDGYAASSAVTWGNAVVGPDGYPITIGDSKLFTVSASPVVTNTIYGYFLVDTAGTGYLGAARFPNPVPMSEGGAFLHVTPVLQMGNLLGV